MLSAIPTSAFQTTPGLNMMPSSGTAYQPAGAASAAGAASPAYQKFTRVSSSSGPTSGYQLSGTNININNNNNIGVIPASTSAAYQPSGASARGATSAYQATSGYGTNAVPAVAVDGLTVVPSAGGAYTIGGSPGSSYPATHITTTTTTTNTNAHGGSAVGSSYQATNDIITTTNQSGSNIAATMHQGPTGSTTARNYSYNTLGLGGETTRNITTSTGQQYEQSRRQVSSTIISEAFLGDMPKQDEVRYVEVPVVEERVQRVVKREVIEREQQVPKVVYRTVEREVEVPEIRYVDKVVEVPQIVEKIVQVQGEPRVIDVPREVVKPVTKVQTVYVEKVVEVPGPVHEKVTPVVVENKIPVVRYQDKHMPVIVAQTVQPVVVEGTETVEVDLIDYEPQVTIVDVHVAKAIKAELMAGGLREEVHRVVTVPAPQYNTFLRALNPHAGEQDLPFMRENGRVTFLPDFDFTKIVTPLPNVRIEGAEALMRDVWTDDRRRRSSHSLIRKHHHHHHKTSHNRSHSQGHSHIHNHIHTHRDRQVVQPTSQIANHSMNPSVNTMYPSHSYGVSHPAFTTTTTTSPYAPYPGLGNAPAMPMYQPVGAVPRGASGGKGSSYLKGELRRDTATGLLVPNEKPTKVCC